ncbi:MAG: lysine biosynthesis protein LysW [Candidatus Aminicenantales bacterium]|jgi:lysine biosynthesis protein LysW
MSLEKIEMTARGECPVCAAFVFSASSVEETEILACPECRTMLVVDGVEGSRLRLSEAPQIEEDWGE